MGNDQLKYQDLTRRIREVRDILLGIKSQDLTLEEKEELDSLFQDLERFGLELKALS